MSPPARVHSMPAYTGPHPGFEARLNMTRQVEATLPGLTTRQVPPRTLVTVHAAAFAACGATGRISLAISFEPNDAALPGSSGREFLVD